MNEDELIQAFLPTETGLQEILAGQHLALDLMMMDHHCTFAEMKGNIYMMLQTGYLNNADMHQQYG
jgi:hypothetical protein